MANNEHSDEREDILLPENKDKGRKTVYSFGPNDILIQAFVMKHQASVRSF